MMLSVEVADESILKDFTPVYLCMHFDDQALDNIKIINSSSTRYKDARESILKSWEKENYYIYKARQMIVEQWEKEDERAADREMN